MRISRRFLFGSSTDAAVCPLGLLYNAILIMPYECSVRCRANNSLCAAYIKIFNIVVFRQMCMLPAAQSVIGNNRLRVHNNLQKGSPCVSGLKAFRRFSN